LELSSLARWKIRVLAGRNTEEKGKPLKAIKNSHEFIIIVYLNSINYSGS